MLFVFQEEERLKQEELENIIRENQRKIEEQQKKMVHIDFRLSDKTRLRLHSLSLLVFLQVLYPELDVRLLCWDFCYSVCNIFSEIRSITATR